jgi:hypothetical protein
MDGEAYRLLHAQVVGVYHFRMGTLVCTPCKIKWQLRLGFTPHFKKEKKVFKLLSTSCEW